MKIITTDLPGFSQPEIGNVYSINGGYGRKAGHAMVLIALTKKKQSCLFMVIDKDGDPVGVTSYGLHAIEERSPIAFVPGIDDLVFTMEALS